MTRQYQVVFKGTLKPGVTQQDAQLRLASLFKTDAAKFEPWFTGKTIIVKKDLAKAQAEKYVLALQNAGLVVELSVESIEIPRWEVAALGSDVLRDDEIPPITGVNVDTSSLRAMDNSELDLTPPDLPPIAAPDIEHLHVLPPGEIDNLLDPRKPLSPDISKLALSEQD